MRKKVYILIDQKEKTVSYLKLKKKSVTANKDL